MKNILVVSLGFYGNGETVAQAAARCVEAGSPKTVPAVVIIADKEVNFRDAMSVSYPDGQPNFQIDFRVKKLGALLA